MTVRVLPMGERAVLVDDLDVAPAHWSAGLRALVVERALGGVIDVVPAARTVLISCDDAAALDRVTALIHQVRAWESEVGTTSVEIPVRYDGADLSEVAAAVGMDVDELIAAHTGPTYEVAFCGFAPGFAYLVGLDPRLSLPRRSTPRVSVPAGSVAIASDYTAVYPRSSPGGWHLLGTTDVTLFDPDHDPPALLTPGSRVRFVPA